MSKGHSCRRSTTKKVFTALLSTVCAWKSMHRVPPGGCRRMPPHPVSRERTAAHSGRRCRPRATRPAASLLGVVGLTEQVAETLAAAAGTGRPWYALGIFLGDPVLPVG